MLTSFLYPFVLLKRRQSQRMGVQLTFEKRKELVKKQMAKIDVSAHIQDINESKELIKKVRILCWIMTSPNSHWKAKVVRDTWGKRCNILVIISSEIG